MICFCANEKQNEILENLKISSKTLCSWFKKFRDVIEIKMNQLLFDKIGGFSETVEIDETKIYTRKYMVGRILKKQSIWILGCVCRETKECAFLVTRRRNREVINNFVLNNINLNTRIISDCWRGYTDINSLGFNHVTINHTENFVDPFDNDIHTNTIERMWRSLKSTIPDSANEKSINSYLKKFVFDKYFGSRNSTQRFQALVNLFKV
jgi:hypothetical protein